MPRQHTPLDTISLANDRAITRASATSCSEQVQANLLTPIQPTFGQITLSSADREIGILSPPSGTFNGELVVNLGPNNSFSFQSTKEDVLVSAPEPALTFSLLVLLSFGLYKTKKTNILCKNLDTKNF